MTVASRQNQPFGKTNTLLFFSWFLSCAAPFFLKKANLSQSLQIKASQWK
jgi:hypothetical protein